MTLRRIVLPLILVVFLAAPARGQDSIQTVRDLYASAAYEDALSVLARLDRADAPIEVYQYKAFCLIALGKVGEAEKAIESVVASNPTYAPGPLDVSPRIQEAFNKARRQMLPDIAKKRYLAAKASLDRNDKDAALEGFKSVVALIDEADAQTKDDLDELRFLAAGFLDLSRALVVVETKPALPEPRPASGTEPAVEISPAVAIRQVMPPWQPTDAVGRQSTFKGILKLSITAGGRVERAEFVRSVHPAYDRLVLHASRSWEYRPATRAGVPVASDQLIEIQLKPPQ